MYVIHIYVYVFEIVKLIYWMHYDIKWDLMPLIYFKNVQ